MAQTAEERQASNVDALTAPEQATPGAAVLPRRPVLVAVLDSGATIHVVSHWRFLSNIRYLRYPMPISVADGRRVYAYAVGDIDTEDIKLKNVYLVPELKMNLVSVRELANIGIITTFYKNHAELCKGAELVGGAIAEGNKSLYQLTYLLATGDGDASNTMPEVPSWYFLLSSPSLFPSACASVHRAPRQQRRGCALRFRRSDLTYVL